jgi:hypothetical protein
MCLSILKTKKTKKEGQEAIHLKLESFSSFLEMFNKCKLQLYKLKTVEHKHSDLQVKDEDKCSYKESLEAEKIQ